MTRVSDIAERRRATGAHSFNAAEFARVVFGWTPDPKQALILQSGARRGIMNCCRQFGKSSIAAAKLAHTACIRPESTSIVVSENTGQTAEVFQKLDRFLSAAGVSIKGLPGRPIARVLPNGSRIIGLAAREAAVRGYTADFVFLDEAARIPDEVMDALLPVVAIRNGDWWMASTPKGRRGRFYQMWAHETDPGILKVKIPWTENPRLAPGYVERMRQTRGEAFVKQEFCCEFIENGEFLLTQGHVTAVEV